MTTYRRKLIEVALPLEAINVASAREKSIRHGHPSTLHLWWARRPLAACRAVLFASLVDDPEEPNAPLEYLKKIDLLPTPPSLALTLERLHEEFKFLNTIELDTKSKAISRRARLFNFIEQLVLWENTNDENILNTARELILAATEGNPPPVLDPFCGGGSIPLEAQRLGLEAHGSDLNPVAVLITKALIELPPKFANQPPINPEAREKFGHGSKWKGVAGLAEDIRFYGRWMRDEAFKQIGHLYPKAKLPKEYGGGEATVIAWLWARTVKCPNPACGAQLILTNSFKLSTKKGKQVWIEPLIDPTTKKVDFQIKSGEGQIADSPKLGHGVNFRCLVCNQSAGEKYIKSEGKARRMSAQMMAIVVEGKKGRIYIAPNSEQIATAFSASPNWKPEIELSTHPQYMAAPRYGMVYHSDLYTSRQLVALTTFSQLVSEVKKQILVDAIRSGLIDDKQPLNMGGNQAEAYANTIATYLGMNVSKLANRSSTLCFWDNIGENVQHVFARQAISMTWDFVEGNPFSTSTGNFLGQLDYLIKVLEFNSSNTNGFVVQRDAVDSIQSAKSLLISTDPPYYDNVPYADLSDFFYVWLRSSLSQIQPELFNTLLVPKKQELVADHQRHGNREEAQNFFEEGLSKTFNRLLESQNPSYPLTIFYAFKQSESEKEEKGNPNNYISSTGWETMLEAILKTGFTIDGTWPIRTELTTNLKRSMSVLASSIVLVCRPRHAAAAMATRREFLNALKAELPAALRNLQSGNIAPVDLAQASIGPGMAVFSRYSKIIESDGTPMRVRTALQLINQALDEVLSEQEGEYDADTRWAISWFDQFGQNEGPFGTAETLSKAKNTSIKGLEEAGFLSAKSGKVRLLRRDELDPDWNPATDRRLTVWEVTQHLIHALDKKGEQAAAGLLATVGGMGEIARDLAYRLYTTCERKGWAQEALAYNTLVVSWPEITRLAQESKSNTVVQGNLGI